MIKVALIQRLCPHYRIPVFSMLSQQTGVDLTLYFGKGQKTGSQQNVKNISGFNHKRLFTLSISIKLGDHSYYMVFHPFLLFHLIRQKFDVIICEGATNFIDNMIIVPYCLLSKTPYIWWDSGRKPGAKRRFQRKLVDIILLPMIRKATACLAYGSVACDYLNSIGVPIDKIFIAQNAIDTKQVDLDIERFDKQAIAEKRMELGINGKKVILYVGALEKRKKVDQLVSVYKTLKEQTDSIALLIIGNGTEKIPLESYVNENSVSDVYFLGRIVENVGIFFLMSDIFVLPSEGGLSINQAMAYGLPVIASSADGTEADLIKDGETGFFFEEDSISDMTKKICFMLEDESIGRSIGLNAQKLILNKINIKNMVKGFIQAIKYVSKM